MSVRFSADGEDYTRTTGLPPPSGFTVSMWVKITTDRNAISTAFCLDNGTSITALQTGADGTTMSLVNSGGTATGVNMTVEKWYWFGFSQAATAGSLYWQAVDANAISGAISIAFTNFATPTTMRFGESLAGAQWLNGSIANVKIWDEVLSTQDLYAERWCYAPQHTANLNSWYPFGTASTADSGPNARTLSGGTGTSSEKGPPVPPDFPWYVAAGTLGAVATGNVTPGLPTGWAHNDVAFLAVMTNAGNTFPTITGWTNLGLDQNSANESTAWYWRRLQTGDTAPAFTIASGTALSTTNGLYARIFAWRNCALDATPFEDATVAGTPTTDTVPQSASIDSTRANTVIFCIVCCDDDNTWSSGFPPAGWTNTGQRLSSTTGGDCFMDGIAIDKAAAGNQAAITVGTMSAADYWKTLTVVLLPKAKPVLSRSLRPSHHASIW